LVYAVLSTAALMDGSSHSQWFRSQWLWELEAMTAIGEIKARSQLRQEYSGINQAARKLLI
jgi:hypothetical protein